MGPMGPEGPTGMTGNMVRMTHAQYIHVMCMCTFMCCKMESVILRTEVL